MTSRIVLGLVLSVLVAAPVGLGAQFGGLLKKKAADVLKGKPAPTETTTEPAPTPAPAPAPATTAAPATTPATGTSSAAAPRAAAPATPSDPLDLANFRLADNANRVLRDEQPGQLPDVPYLGKATSAALKALDDGGRVAFVQKAGAALKSLVMSETFVSAHAEAIKRQYDAVDHGLKVSTPDQMMKKGDFAAYEAYNKRQMAANIVDTAEKQSGAEIKRIIPFQLDSWRESARSSTGPSKARSARILKEAEAILAMTDEAAIRRGYALIRSLEVEGPDTTAALYAEAEQGRKEAEQVAWNEHNLKGVLKQQLTAFVALVPTVDFAAKTADKNGRQVFVSAAHERQGSLWKACYRAGKPAVTAAQAFAQAWLKEL
ncbi:hypothetical protein TBR22_A03540 [Luteitalea sp. TBR-22]|uniref:hypothetical protein n=1 Tax=Luteitalea sp. TBR-22 TaxID=2802971 RepID=UPI001AF65466|nr:hypothetical protein [Luteitalea sp. TBR-22]BCS31154.1 hypothetical protein TBR22_A03540 [Luteitalea sp. TBR-22]